jgi:hypothetical protein
MIEISESLSALYFRVGPVPGLGFIRLFIRLFQQTHRQ